QLLRPPFEQRDAEKILEHDDVPANRALRNRQTVGGGREAQMLPSRLERTQGVERQPFAIHHSSPRTRRETSADARFREQVDRRLVAHAGFVREHDMAALAYLQGL